MMKVIKPLLMVFIFTFALLFGLFYHISSSEFWPITISKTVWTWGLQESSIWQKPVFNLFLSLFHFIPALTDTQHLQLIKATFAALGFISLLLFCSSIRRLIYDNDSSEIQMKDFFIGLILLLLSPFYLNNFFRIRSDQFTFFILSLSLYFYSLNKKKWSLGFLILSTFVSLKSMVLILPFVFLIDLKTWPTLLNIQKRAKIYFMGSLIALVIWFLAINLTAFSYFLNSIEHPIDFIFLKTYLLTEASLIFFSIFLGIWIYFKASFLKLNNTRVIKGFIKSSLLSLILVLISPQSLPFFISSLIPFVYLPLVIYWYSYVKNSDQFLWTSLKSWGLVIFIAAHFGLHFYWVNINTAPYFRSNSDQFEFISNTSPILKRHQLTYLDGMGLYPRQKYLSCFYSPNDDESNTNCLNLIQNHAADVFVYTGRLNSFNENLLNFIKEDYQMIQPNFWIKKSLSDKYTNTDVTSISGPLPILIFGM